MRDRSPARRAAARSAAGGGTTLLVALLVAVCSPAPAAVGGESQAPLGDPLRFWRPDRAATEREFEAALRAVPDPTSLARHHELLSSAPHVVGTPGDLAVIDALERAFSALGLEVERQELWLYLPRPLAAELEIVAPERLALGLREDVLPEDPYSADPRLDFGWNAWSGSSEVTDGVVYANFGTKADFERLRQLGVAVAGRIVVARYGGNYRGYKAKFAAAAGAAGLILYTDPEDGGYGKGLMYPEGGWENDSAIQRGSLLTLPYPGDPLTPFVAATEGASRLDPAALDLPRIPVQPVGWRAARAILERMEGPPVPDDKWQGGLPFNYRLTGGDALRVRLKVEQAAGLTRTANVVATLRGAVYPDELVIVGCHHDAWSFGAGDPNAGSIVVYEAARSFAAAAARGRRPARTLVFANWAAEEPGIVGSVEWVEAHAAELGAHAVAYLNLDMAVMGTDFEASAAPTLGRAIVEATAAVTQVERLAAVEPPAGTAGGGRTVYDAWLARSGARPASDLPELGTLGGSSDHVGFYSHLGIPAAGVGAGGSPGASYHTAYEDLAWYRKVVGDDYRPAVMVTQVVDVLLARLADPDLLPLEPAAYGREAREHLDAIAKRARELGVDVDLGPLLAAARRQEERGSEAEKDLLAALAAGLDAASLARANAILLVLEREWLLAEGLFGRPWFRNLYAAPDADSGYAAWMLPALRQAVEERDADGARAAVALYLGVFERLESRLDELAALAVTAVPAKPVPRTGSAADGVGGPRPAPPARAPDGRPGRPGRSR